jgi:hypothetical protein
MIRVLFGVFIVAHRLLTAFISWLIGDARPLAIVIALVAAAGFVLAGVGIIADQVWWAVTGVGAGVVALVLMTLFFNPCYWPASPSAPGSSTPGSKPCRRPSGTARHQGGHHDPVPN